MFWMGEFDAMVAHAIVIGLVLLTRVDRTVQQGQQSNSSTEGPPQQGCCGKQSEATRLGGGAVASIVLGAVLLIIFTATIVTCCLVKKGYLRSNKEQSTSKVLPGLMGLRSRMASFRTTSERSTTGREDPPSPRKQDNGPIIYLYDDIYRPPRSLALPEQFQSKPDKKVQRHGGRHHKKRKHPRAHTVLQMPRREPEVKGDDDVVVVPDTSANYRMIGGQQKPQASDGGYIRTYD